MGFDIQLLLHGDLKALIQAIGYLGVFTMVFLESGMMFGFFFPGDSLLFTAGFLASQGFFDITILIVGCFTMAVAGDSAGFYLGHKFGRQLFSRQDSLFFHKDHLIRAEQFYLKHGGKTIILARFVPVIRAFAPVAAGIGSMNYSAFLFYNILGGILWAIGISLAGFYLGSIIPDVDKYLLPTVALIILASISPGIYHAIKNNKSRQKILTLLKIKT